MYKLENVKLISCEKLKIKKEDGSIDPDARLFKLMFEEELSDGFTEKHLFYVNDPELDYQELAGKYFDVTFKIQFSQEAKIRGKKAVVVEQEKVKLVSATQV